jgi:hypothetical protein
MANYTWFGRSVGNASHNFQQLLGLSLVANSTWIDNTIPTKLRGTPARPSRVLSAHGVEALEAALMGRLSGVDINGYMLVFAVAPEAYEHSVVSSQIGVLAGPVIAGVEPQGSTIFTNLASTSTRWAGNAGKTELSSFAAMLLMAINDYRLDGHQQSKDVVGAYYEMAKEVDAIAALPLSAGSIRRVPTTPAATISRLEELVRKAMDALYIYAAYTREMAFGRSAATTHSWSLEHRALTTVPNLRPGSRDLAELLTDVQALAGFLGDRQWPRPAAQSPQPAAAPPAAPSPSRARAARATPRATTPSPTPLTPARPRSAFDDLIIGSALCTAEDEGGCANLIVTGPPAGGKTTGLLEASDSMPTVIVELSEDMLTRDLTASVERNPDGTWGPVLHPWARACRTAMLRALVIALSRGGEIAGTLGKFKPAVDPVAKVLAQLAADPGDKDVVADLDRVARPEFGETWAAVDSAYWESGAPAVGPVFRFVFDEIFDGARNRKLNTFLKGIMAKRRLFSLGIAGSLPLTALNVHITAAGNASAADKFQSAVVSRFHCSYALPKPTNQVLISRAKFMVKAAQEAAASKPKSQKPPINFALVEQAYTPPVRQIAELTDACYEKLAEFSEFTCTQYQAKRFAEPVDARGVIALASMIAHMKGGGMGERAAFEASAKSVVSKVAKIDPIWGLPVAQDMTDLITKITALSAAIR